ncbi:MAG: membrane protein insertion efficiency factor YidD [Deltaproteobacteria bacterium]|nr:membrane protein insertion efficiency factor YidD [Deltaproteobacteria bacterium]MCL5891626.1 membrane protein insertion efficiency factor YidD [Deltaproteobacteria bacterium]MDA8273434.1 membrane protein insertion efficiency factor YidD [Deltaproteobacteria bacterium]
MLNKIFIGIINFYKRFISPLLPQSCRFYPTCSEYALECFKSFGFIKALYLSSYRILRCNPLSKGGYDPVPRN